MERRADAIGRWMVSGLLMGLVGVGAHAGAGSASVAPAGQGPGTDPVGIERLVVVTDDVCAPGYGCDAVSVFDLVSFAPLLRGRHFR